MVDQSVVENDRSLAESVSELESLAQKALELEGEARDEIINQIKDRCLEEGLSDSDVDDLLEEIGLISEKASLPGSKTQGDTAPQKVPGNAEEVTPSETLKAGQQATKKVSKRKGDQEGTDGSGPDANKAEDVTGKFHVAKEDISFNVADDVKALLEGEEFPEEFAQKATTIFEAAVNSKVATILDDLQEGLNVKFNEELEKGLEEQRTELVEKIDNYLNYVAEQWMEENKLAVETGIKAELTENFLTGLKTLFTEHYVNIPEEKVDVVEELFVEVEQLKEELNKQMASSIATKQELQKYKKEHILNSLTEGLSATQTEKMKSLVQSVDEDDIEVYTKKVELMKENYFPTTQKTTVDVTEAVEETEELNEENELSHTMKHYTSAITRTIR